MRTPGTAMRSGVALAAVLLLGSRLGFGRQRGGDRERNGLRVENPIRYRNLAIYVVRGEQIDSRPFLTLEEGLRTKTVVLREHGSGSGEDRARVNELEIENRSDQWLFLQAGDVIEGGKQDRTIGVDVTIPPNSAARPIAAFCVEHGRWTPKRAGDMAFQASPAIAGSNALKKSIQKEKSQPEVWAQVAREELRAAAAVSVTGAAIPLSGTGTYSAIVDQKTIREERSRYVESLLPGIQKARDAVGLVVAINGRITAADVYGSPALLQKLARKLLDSYALEAVLSSREKGASASPPKREAARSFLLEAADAPGKDEEVADSVHRTTRDSKDATLFEYTETDSATGSRRLLHKNVVKN